MRPLSIKKNFWGKLSPSSLNGMVRLSKEDISLQDNYLEPNGTNSVCSPSVMRDLMRAMRQLGMTVTDQVFLNISPFKMSNQAQYHKVQIALACLCGRRQSLKESFKGQREESFMRTVVTWVGTMCTVNAACSSSGFKGNVLSLQATWHELLYHFNILFFFSKLTYSTQLNR